MYTRRDGWGGASYTQKNRTTLVCPAYLPDWCQPRQLVGFLRFSRVIPSCVTCQISASVTAITPCSIHSGR
jgi:hypothetical protein